MLFALSLTAGLLLVQEPAAQAGRDTAAAQNVDSLVVTGRYDDLIGIAASASEGRIGAADLRLRPITREGELLETVPGLIVTQHSGDGKANQYFIRGFNLDHGTDFQTRIEGMPLNMPSHAHGQGYTDVNFLIPELVDYLDYRLGVYHPELGDFGSAGGAEFHLVKSLRRPFASVTGGEDGLARLAAGASTALGGGNLLVGGEAKSYDGPWQLAQELRKFSGMARYSWDRGDVAVLSPRDGLPQPVERVGPDSAPGGREPADRPVRHHRPHRRRRDPALQPVGQLAPRRRAVGAGRPALRGLLRPEPVLELRVLPGRRGAGRPVQPAGSSGSFSAATRGTSRRPPPSACPT